MYFSISERIFQTNKQTTGNKQEWITKITLKQIVPAAPYTRALKTRYQPHPRR